MKLQVRVLSILIVSLGLMGALIASVSRPSSARASSSVNNTALDYAPGEVLIKVRDDVVLTQLAHQPVKANRSALTVALTDLGTQSGAPVFASNVSPDLKRVYRIKFDPQADLATAIKRLTADPNVEYAEPNYIAHAATAPNDPLYSSQWALAKINAPAAWNVVTGTPGVVIAIIDSGIDTTHPDLAGRLWINPGEIPGNGIDDDNNGYIDDVNGWNFVGSNNNVSDDNGHGTQVAGVAGASTNNAIGIAGMCWNCRLMIVKAMQASGVANYSDIAAAVNYAAAKGAQVINVSLGGYADSATLRAAIDAASSTAVIVGGAGNDNVSTPFYPAAYSNVLAVASTTISDTKASFSNYGPWVEVAAPGVAISTTFSGGDYGTSDGTSLSAPLAAGLAGLLKSTHPDWSPALIRAQIIHTTDVITDTQLGSGRINAASAMQVPRSLFSIGSYTVNGTANGHPDPNSSNALIVGVANDWLDATNVVATLTETDPFVTVITGTASFGNIASGVTQSSAPFSFTVASGAGYNHPIAFTLNLSANGGAYVATLPLSITTASGIINVQGTIASNTIWTNDKTYIVSNNIGVAPGVTLTIQPGTVIKFNGNYTLNVAGTLIADGTTAQPIRFTREAMATWGQIKFLYSSTAATFDGAGNYTGGSIIRRAIIEYGQSINLELAGPFIAENAFQNMSSNAITGAPPYGGLSISDNTFINSGIELFGTDQTGNAILRNQITGGAIRMTTKATISGNSITHCNGQGISAVGGTVSNNRVVGCAEGIFMIGNSGLVSGNLVSNNGQYGLHVYSPVTVTNNTVINNLVGLYVEGTPTPVVVYSNNLIASAGSYAVRLATGYGINNNVNAAGNYWGTTNDTGIQQAIYDGMDEFGLGIVNYSGFLSDAVQTAPAYVQNVTVAPDTTLGIQTGTFNVQFSRPMDQSTHPIVTFGSTAPYTAFVVLDTAQWITNTVWRATYDITSLVPRGAYTISVSGVNGLDEILIPTDTRFGFTVDYAGSITDQTPPPAPSLNVDFCANSTTAVSAQWSASDPNSTITLYRYALGSSTNSSDVINWTDTGNTSVTRTGLNLVAGQRYYFSAKARNAGGLWSESTSRSFNAGVPCQKVYLPLVRK